MANSTVYGLSAEYIYGKYYEGHRVASKIDAGVI